MPDTFVTLKDILVYCNINPQETKYSEFLNKQNAIATEKIQTWLGRDIFKTQYCEYYDIKGAYQNLLQLENYPIISVEGVTNNDTTLLSSQYYVYNDLGALKKASGCWYNGTRKVRITYTAGYANIPLCVQDAALNFVRKRLDSRTPENIKSFSGGGISWTKSDPVDGLDSDIALMISHLRRTTHADVST